MNEQTGYLFIGGPDSINGTLRCIPNARIYVYHEIGECTMTATNVGEPIPIIRHEYRRVEMGQNLCVYFHESISEGQEMAALIQAATKKL